jgi:uncharacterized protein (DUF1499 family)
VIPALAFVLLASADRYTPASRMAQSPALAPCPERPNCVSTAATDSAKHMNAWSFTVPAATARAAIEQIVRAHPRTNIIDTREDYVHATFTSRIFRFVDDVEFRIDTTTRTVHFRSASRVGYSDLGVNRRRMTALREDFLRSVQQ